MSLNKLAAALSFACWLTFAIPAQADVVYSVRSGDTVDRIAASHNVSSEQILQANPKIRNGVVREGLVLVIPTRKNTGIRQDDASAYNFDQDAPAPSLVKIDPSLLNRTGDRYRNQQLASRGGMTLDASRLLQHANRYMGTPYVFGATGNGAFDCSGFTMRMFQLCGVNIPRTADVQFGVGQRVARGEERPGDLVFFETYLPGPSHVGIYVGNGNFIHASSSRGVTINSLGQSYYSARYLGAKRIFK